MIQLEFICPTKSIISIFCVWISPALLSFNWVAWVQVTDLGTNSCRQWRPSAISYWRSSRKKQRAVATVDQGDWLVDEADFLFLLKHTRYCWIMSKLTCHLGLDIFVYLNVISDIFHTPVGEVHECETLDTSFCFDVAGLSPLRSHSLDVQHHRRKVRGQIGVVASSCSFGPQDAWY